MANSFGSFYADASGGEGDRCKYPTRLDTYGCGEGEGVVTYLTCQSCGAEVEYSKKEDYDEANARA